MAVSKAAALEATIGPAVKLFTAASTAPATTQIPVKERSILGNVDFNFSILLFSKMFRFYISIDKRSQCIHDQDGK